MPGDGILWMQLPQNKLMDCAEQRQSLAAAPQRLIGLPRSSYCRYVALRHIPFQDRRGVVRANVSESTVSTTLHVKMLLLDHEERVLPWPTKLIRGRRCENMFEIPPGTLFTGHTRCTHVVCFLIFMKICSSPTPSV